MKTFYGSLKIGILGGGQLGRMWIQNALNYNVNVSILDPDKDAPCKNICDDFQVGSLADFDTVYEFGKKVDLLTIEIEKVNVEALKKLVAEGVKVYPEPHIIELIQDKGTQKQWLKEHHIPTSDFKLIDSKSELNELKWSFPYVQKLRRDGYDGKGVFIIKEKSQLTEAFEAPSLVEQMVDFEKEIAIIVARNESGEIKTFPAVEMDFHPTANLVEFQISPAAVSDFIQLKAANIAENIAEELGLIGLLAIEFFVCKNGEVLVNEMAPRPHNSGHQSIEGNVCSQFDQHLRAITGQPLGDTSNRANAVMINLLGEAGFSGEAIYQGLEEVLHLPGVYIHLYGKKITKPFRKMGHVTIIHNDRDQAIKIAKEVKEKLKVISK
jgi:5-(carboxyamino)imidazole ribonucleotide synthase